MIQRRRLKPLYVSILSLVGDAVALEARERIIGRISPLQAVPPFNAWSPLKASTIKQKERKGWGKNGDPYSMLWATGKLDYSISYRIEKGRARVIIGTNVPYAGYLEYGTIHMGPRPFMGPAMVRTLPRLKRDIERMWTATLAGRRI